jgi:hypothetical protein
MKAERSGWRLAPAGEPIPAALALVKERKPDKAFLRAGRDGAVELVTFRDATGTRYSVHPGGAVEIVETIRPRPRWRIGNRLAKGGLLCVPLIIVAGILLRPANSNLLLGLPFAFAFLAVFVGALLMAPPQKDKLLERSLGSSEGWTRLPYDLGGWEPATVIQLAAALDLMEGGGAVRDLGGGHMEVVTTRKRREERYVLDAAGAVVEHVSEPLPRHALWASPLVGVGLFASLLVALGQLGHDWLLVALAVGTFVLLALLANRLDERLHGNTGGPGWFRVQLEPPSD